MKTPVSTRCNALGKSVTTAGSPSPCGAASQPPAEGRCRGSPGSRLRAGVAALRARSHRGVHAAPAGAGARLGSAAGSLRSPRAGGCRRLPSAGEAELCGEARA